MPPGLTRALPLTLLLSLAVATSPASGLHQVAWERKQSGARGEAHPVGGLQEFLNHDLGEHDRDDRESSFLQLTLSVFLFGSIVVACCLLQFGVCTTCFRATREYLLAKMRGGRFSGVRVLVVWGEDSKDIAERLAYTLFHEYGCRVRGAPQFWLEGVWRQMSCEDWDAAEGAEAILVVLSPRVFESEVSRRTLAEICTQRPHIPMIPVYAGGLFAKDDLKQLYKSKLALKLTQAELASLELVRRQVFAENMADVENEHHKRRTKVTLRRIVQRFENEARPSLLVSGLAHLTKLIGTFTDPYFHDVFISYSTADNRQTFENLRACFVDLGCNVFNPTVDMQGGKVSLEVMQRHVKGSRVLVVMPGRGHCKSVWCRGEVLAGIEAKIPIVRAFAGQATTMKALLTLRDEDPKRLAGDDAVEEVVEEVRKIRDFTFQPPMVDVRNEDHMEETVKAAKRIAFKHLPWARRRWVLRRFARALALPTLAVVMLFNTAASFGPRMQRYCKARDVEGLRDAIWWVKRLPLGRYMHSGHLVGMRSCLHEIQVASRIRQLTAEIHNEAEVDDALEELKEIVRQNRGDQKLLLTALSALEDCWSIKATTLQDKLFGLMVGVIQYASGRDSVEDELTLITAIQVLTSIFARGFLSGGVLRERSEKTWDAMRDVLNTNFEAWRVIVAGVRLLKTSEAPVISSHMLNDAQDGGPSLLDTLVNLTRHYQWHEGVEVDLMEIFARISAADRNREPIERFTPRLCGAVVEVLMRPNTSLAVIHRSVSFFERLADRVKPSQRCQVLMDCGGLQALSDAVARVDYAMERIEDLDTQMIDAERSPRQALDEFAQRAIDHWEPSSNRSNDYECDRLVDTLRWRWLAVPQVDWVW